MNSHKGVQIVAIIALIIVNALTTYLLWLFLVVPVFHVPAISVPGALVLMTFGRFVGISDELMPRVSDDKFPQAWENAVRRHLSFVIFALLIHILFFRG